MASEPHLPGLRKYHFNWISPGRMREGVSVEIELEIARGNARGVALGISPANSRRVAGFVRRYSTSLSVA